ncbi:hypothetical protein [Priestia megaterium]|uniref:hypothetical protein n=1 Tax=Priestia megaterium TaxID=1404 RepID=UPI000BFB1B88|nr:hypothetical protein [Priestia megaterium]PGT69792.1 hypothetical protein COD15_21200 [Priestia megaterium]PGX77547.1 hypothetical protein COE31_18720 [Priestia megaterium]QLC88550.1 hypothetical protein HW576_19125 [Priestia megaterium]
MKDAEKLLSENEVAFPPAPPERLEAGLDDILCRARFQDPKVAAAISMEIAAGIVLWLINWLVYSERYCSDVWSN